MKFIPKKQLFLALILALGTQSVVASGFFKKLGKIAALTTAAYGLHRGYQAIRRAIDHDQWTMGAHGRSLRFPENDLPEGAPIRTIFVHGFGGSGSEAKRYCSSQRGIPHTFDFQHSVDLGDSIQPSCFAQQADIEKIAEEYQKVITTGHKVHFHSLSCGASALIGFLATYQPKNVHSVILESPFDEFESIIANKLTSINRIELVGSMVSAAATLAATWIPSSFMQKYFNVPVGFNNHSVYRLRPVDYVKHISHNIPLLFISSVEDTLVPATSTHKLYTKLKETGHAKSYHTILSHGQHVNLQDGKSGKAYHEAINSFCLNPDTTPRNAINTLNH